MATLFRWLWVNIALLIPLEWRASLVPGWATLHAFVKHWLYSLPDTRREVAMKYLSVGHEGESTTPVGRWLQRLGSLTLAFMLIEGEKKFNPASLPPQTVQDLFRQRRVVSKPTTVTDKKGKARDATEDVLEDIGGDVQWRTVGSTSAAQLSAFRLLPEGVRE